jgi:hypothetical protein
MTAISFHLTEGRSFRPMRTRAGTTVQPATEVEFRNAHRVAGWAIALTVTAALCAVPVWAVTGIAGLL